MTLPQQSEYEQAGENPFGLVTAIELSGELNGSRLTLHLDPSLIITVDDLKRATELMRAAIHEALSTRKQTPTTPPIEDNDRSPSAAHYCALHRANMVYSEGTSRKTGKPYKMWKCPQPGCDTVEWVR